VLLSTATKTKLRLAQLHVRYGFLAKL